jgi:hypothetical protein
MKKFYLMAIALFSLSGCAVAMSAKRSTYQGNPAIIQVGADRMQIENTFGSPNMTASLPNGESKVIYKIDPNAHRKVTRNSAVAGHVVADVLTFGLWEIIGTPLELAAQDDFTTYMIVYDRNNLIKSVDVVK